MKLPNDVLSRIHSMLTLFDLKQLDEIPIFSDIDWKAYMSSRLITIGKSTLLYPGKLCLFLPNLKNGTTACILVKVLLMKKHKSLIQYLCNLGFSFPISIICYAWSVKEIRFVAKSRKYKTYLTSSSDEKITLLELIKSSDRHRLIFYLKAGYPVPIILYEKIQYYMRPWFDDICASWISI